MKLTRIFTFLYLLLSSAQPLFSQQTPAPRLGHTQTNVGEKIIMFGGDFYDNASNLNNELWDYDQDSDSWTMLNPTGTAPDPVSGHAAVAFNDALYIIGGQTVAGFTADQKMTLHKYSVSENVWTEVNIQGSTAPLLTTDLVAQVIGDFIYVNGGSGFSSTTNETWRFNLNTLFWEQLAPSPFEEYGHCSAVFNGKFYLLRGLIMGHLVTAYDPATNSWETITPQIDNADSTNKPAGVYRAATWFDETGVYSIGGDDFTNGGGNFQLGKQKNQQLLTPTAVAFGYNFLLNTWRLLDCFELFPVYNATATGLTGSLALVTGGWNGTQTIWVQRIIDCPKGQGASYTLEVSVEPQEAADKGASVTITPDKGEYDEGESVTLEANNGTDGWVLKEWSGDATGSNMETSVSMTGSKLDKKVVAHFVQPELFVSSSGPGRKVVAPEDAHDNLVKIIDIDFAANEIDDWIVNSLKFKNLIDKKSINKARITTQDGMIEGTINADTTEISFSFYTPIFIPKGTKIVLSMFYEIFLPEEDRTCEMDSVREYRVSIDRPVDVSAKPLTYPDGLKIVQAPIYSYRTFIACAENEALWGFANLDDAIVSEKTVEKDVLTVYKGEYTNAYEKLSAPITLKSKDGAENTLIKRDMTTNPWQYFDFQSDDLIIDGFTFSDGSIAIRSENRFIENCIIRNCIFDNFGEVAIRIKDARNFIVEFNTFNSNPIGISLTTVDASKISENTFNSNPIGISLTSADAAKITENTFNSNPIGISLTTVDASKISENTFNSNPIGISLTYSDSCQIRDNKFNLSDTSQILLKISKIGKGNIISGNKDDNLIGKILYSSQSPALIEKNKFNYIRMENTENLIFSENIVSKILIRRGKKNTIEYNTVYNSDSNGIQLLSSHENLISGNDIIGANYNGIEVDNIFPYDETYSSVIKNNKITGSKKNGVVLYNAPKTKIIDNEIYSNKKSGIKAGGGYTLHVNNSLFKGNKIYNNGEEGLELTVSNDCNIEWNDIWNNGGYGIRVSQCKDPKILNNFIKGHKKSIISAGIYASPIYNTILVQGNTITNNCNGVFFPNYLKSGKLILKNNKIKNSSCSFTGIHIENGEAELTGNQITGNNGAGIALYNDATAVISGNNIYDNPDLAILNDNPNNNLAVDNNYWGSNTGPGEDDFDGNVHYSNWLETPISLVISLASDTLKSVSGKTDSTNIALQNFALPNDQIEVTLSDEKGWLLNSGTTQVDLVDSSFTILPINFFVPTDAGDNFNNKVTISAVSLNNSEMTAVDSFYILNYTPQLTTIEISPDSITIGYGDTLQFTSSPTDQYGKVFNGDYFFDWFVSSGTIDSTGVFAAPNHETIVNIEALDSVSNISGSAKLSVLQNPNIPSKITITPDSVSTQANSFVQFFARGYDSNGFIVEFDKVWSSDAGIIDSTGLLITGENPGIYTVTVTDKSGSVSAEAYVRIGMISDVETNSIVTPETYSLKSNYPNPFNPKTIITYELPHTSRVKLSVYNVLGQKVADLVDNEILNGAGYKIEWDATQFSSGIYFLVIDAKSVSSDKQFHSVKKMMLMK